MQGIVSNKLISLSVNKLQKLASMTNFRGKPIAQHYCNQPYGRCKLEDIVPHIFKKIDGQRALEIFFKTWEKEGLLDDPIEEYFFAYFGIEFPPLLPSPTEV